METSETQQNTKTTATDQANGHAAEVAWKTLNIEKAPNGYFETKAAEINGAGCLVQTITGNKDHTTESWSVTTALTFVSGVKISGTSAAGFFLESTYQPDPLHATVRRP